MPAALGDKAQFTRKRTAAAPAGGATDDEVADVMRAAVKKARASQLPRHPRRPSLWQSPRRLQRQCPRPRLRRQSKWHRASLRSKPCQRRGVGSKPEIVLTNFGCRIWRCSSPHVKERGQAFLGRAPDAVDNGQVPRDGAANLLLSAWT